MRVFDGHCDTVLRLYQDGRSLFENEGHLDLVRMAAHGQWAQFFALFWDQAEKLPAPEKSLWDVFQAEYQVFTRELERNSDKLTLCRTAEEIKGAWAAGRQAALLSVEGAELLDCDLS